MKDNAPYFFAEPQPHHHVSRLMVLIIFLVILLALGAVYGFFLKGEKANTDVQQPTNSDVLTIEQKTEMAIQEQLRNYKEPVVSPETEARIQAQLKNYKPPVISPQERARIEEQLNKSTN